MPEFHYPGYNFLGPGTDLSKKRTPINSLDAKARKHDYAYQRYKDKGYTSYYWRPSKADEDFIKETQNEKSFPGLIAHNLFKIKRSLADAFGIESIPDFDFIDHSRTFKKAKRTSKKNSPFMMKYLRRARKLRFKRKGRSKFRRYTKGRGRRRSSKLFQKIMNILNPVRKYRHRHYYRAIGTINRRNYVPICQITLADNNLGWFPNAHKPITSAITNAMGVSDRATAANWNKGEEYYVKTFYKWHLSNNSNVHTKATIYWLKYKSDSNQLPLDNIIANTGYFDDTGIFPNNATVDVITATNNITGPVNDMNFNSPMHINVLTQTDFKSEFRRKWSVKKGKTLIFVPGQSKIITYKKKWRLYRYSDLFDTGGSRIEFPRGTVFPILVWDGDVLPGTKTPNDFVGPYTVLNTGVNMGDWSYSMQSFFSVRQKSTNTKRIYIDEQGTGELTATTNAQLLVFGQDNNTAGQAI